MDERRQEMKSAAEGLRAERMPDREALIMSLPETPDSGLMLEQERT